jgi:hypothetical protein
MRFVVRGLAAGHKTEMDCGFELAYAGFTAPQQTTSTETHTQLVDPVHLSTGTTVPMSERPVTNATVEGSSANKSWRLFGVDE